MRGTGVQEKFRSFYTKVRRFSNTICRCLPISGGPSEGAQMTVAEWKYQRIDHKHPERITFNFAVDNIGSRSIY